MRSSKQSCLVVAAFLVTACTAAEESDTRDTGDVGSADTDPLAACDVPENAVAREPDLVGNCDITTSLTVVLDSFDSLTNTSSVCREDLDALEALMSSNPDQHVALAVYANPQTCGVAAESAVGYASADTFTATYVVRDESNECESRCAMFGTTWFAWLVEPGTNVDFCGAVIGGCE